MASIKQLDDRRFKITVSNGYRPDGKKICKAKTIRVPESIPKRGIRQYVSHEAEELERQFKSGYGEDGNMTFEEFAERWLARQVRYAPGTLESYRRMLGRMYPFIGSVPINRLRPIALENMLVELRKRKYRGKPIGEATVQKYLTVVSAVLSDAKRNEIIQKNPEERVEYVLVSAEGPDHDKKFVVEVHLNSNVIGRGASRSKKGAEQAAAHEALTLMGEE